MDRLQVLEHSSPYKVQKLFGRETEFGLLAGHMDLKQNVHALSLPLSLAVNGHEQSLRIDAFYQRSGGYHGLDLVRLEMADEVPADVGGKCRGLGRQLLGAALSEKPLACSVGLENGLRRVKFRNSDKAHPLGQSSAYLFKPCAYRFHLLYPLFSGRLPNSAS